MYHDHRFNRNETPLRVTLMRGLTVLTFMFVVLNVLGWGRLGSDRPLLPPDSITAANQALDEMLAKARATGTSYTYERAAGDLDLLGAMSSAMQGFRGCGISDTDGPLEALGLQRKLEYVRHEIGGLAMYHSGVKEKGYMVDSYFGGRAIQQHQQKFGDTPRPAFLPPAPDDNINWRSVAKRGIDGWLLAMIPAFLTILLSFRLRRESLLAELAERPWWPVLSTVLWPFGLWGYVGQPGIIERRLQALVREYQDEHHADPSQEWLAAQRLIQMRRARDLQQAMAKLAEYPELIQVTSRRAIFTSWVIAMLAGPVNLMIGAVQAYANVARASGGLDSTQVDMTRTPRRRDVSGRAFGVMTYNGERGFNLATLWGIITMKNGRVTGDAWVDLRQPVVMQASATVAVTDEIGLEAGRIWTPVGGSLPAPDKGLFPASSLGSHFPAAAGDGVALHATTTKASLVASAQSGATPSRTDVSLLAKGQAGPLRVYGGVQSGSQRFRFGQFEATWLGLLVREMVVQRLDRNTAAASTDVVYQRGAYRGGLHLEHDRWQVSLERKLDPHSRAVIHVGQTDGVAGTAITAKVQYGFALAP